MARPTDWWVLDLEGDPTPGSPAAVRRMARTWSVVADDAAWGERRLRQLMGDEALGRWIGEAGDAFRSKTEDLPGQLGKCADSYGRASDALSWWAGRLETHQHDADAALDRGRAAHADLEEAKRRAAAAASSLSHASGAAVLTDPSLTPTPEQVRDARARLHSAQAARSSADAAVSAAQSRLDAARRLALDAKHLRESDGRTTAERIHDAAEAGIPERSRWDKLKDWAGEAWHVVVQIAKVVVAVLGVVALIIGGPLAWVVFAAALVLLADAIAKYMKGEGSLWEVGLALLGCIPGTKGLTTLAELRAAFALGGLAKAGGLVGGRLVTMGRQIAAQADVIRTGFVPGMRAVVRVLGNDAGLSVIWSRAARLRTTSAFMEAATPYASRVSQARLWQGAAPYTGIDRYVPTVLQPGSRIEAGAGGLGFYATEAGTAERMGYSAPAVWEHLQVGPGPAGTQFAGYRGHMVPLEVNNPIDAATGVVHANPHFGSGGGTQYFLDINQGLATGDLSLLDRAGNVVDIPAGASRGDISTIVNSHLGNGSHGVRLHDTTTISPGILDTAQAGHLHEVPNGFRTGARGTGYVGDTAFATQD
jgi:hypothetical protein